MPSRKLIDRSILCALLAILAAAVSQADVLEQLEPFLADHCFDCHDTATSKGELDLETLSFEPSDPANFAMWQQVFDLAGEGAMPPKKKKRPDKTELAEFLANLKQPLIAAARAQVAKTGRVQGRRLTRVEYQNTIHDLLGVDLPVVENLPADESESEFETVAEGQQLSHFHLEKYLAAADSALSEAFARAIRGDQTYQKNYGPRELTRRSGGNYRGPDTRNGKVITWPLRLQFFGRMPATRVPESGWYHITLKSLRAINPGPDGVVWGSLQSGGGNSAEPILHYIGSAEGTSKARGISFEAWIREGHLLVFKPTEASNRVAPSGAGGGNVSFRGRDFAKQGFAGLEFEGIEVTRIYPNATREELRRKLLPDVTFVDGKPVIADQGKELHRLIKTFATRAFRRPVTDEQVAAYRKLAADTLKKTGRLQEALRTGYRAILCSPRFLTFVESPGKLDDHALATRLSYLFWASMPDWQLRDLANRGELSKPAVFKQQVNRLLDHERSQRFITNFTDQWLELNEIAFTSPDRRYRDFDPIVQDSMVQETRSFFGELIRRDLSVTNFLQSDFVMLNTRMKAFYRMMDAKVIPGEGMQRVQVGEKGRNGLLTQASIMKVTADGAVTSPILRGVWVNERILGLPIPPPPPNIPAVEPDIRGAVSIRDQLAKHSSDSSCAGCHAKIDPAGFALESFDPIGQWRTKYGTSKKSASVDPSGVTPDGVRFADFWQWRKIYRSRPEQLAEAFAHQFLTYATGAPILFSDREAIESILAAVSKSDYGLRSLIHAAVASEVFQSK